MTTTIAFINMKGGVAKSTTTVATAQILAGVHTKKVLLIDLDPQTNATVMCIGEQRWKELNDAGHTAASIFRAAVRPGTATVDLQSMIQRGVGNVDQVRKLDLLPSSLDLIAIQDELVTMPAGQFHTARPVDILYNELYDIVNEGTYDYILIDCPPSLGLVTLNGLRFADGYVIPTVSDVLSTYGVPQVMTRIAEFARKLQKTIEPYGILITKFQIQSTVQKTTQRALRQDPALTVFRTVIPQANDLASSAEYQRVSTLRQKWGTQVGFAAYRDFVIELLQRVGDPTGRAAVATPGTSASAQTT